jgi:hypothetical protein
MAIGPNKQRDRQTFPVRVAFFRGPDREVIELLEDKADYN